MSLHARYRLVPEDGEEIDEPDANEPLNREELTGCSLQAHAAEVPRGNQWNTRSVKAVF
jgi:hypothetical protein